MFCETFTLALFLSIALCVQSKTIDINRRRIESQLQNVQKEGLMQGEGFSTKNDIDDDNQLYKFSNNDVVVELLPHRGFDGPISTEDDSFQQITEQQPEMEGFQKTTPLLFDSIQVKTGDDEQHDFGISPQLLDEPVYISHQQINEPPLSNEPPEVVYVDEKSKRSHHGLPKVCHPIKKRRKCFHLMIAEKKIYKICKNVLEKICSSLD